MASDSEQASLVLEPGRPVTPVNRNDEWATPHAFVDQWVVKLGLDFDLAASDLNHKLPNYWTREDDALGRPWYGKRGWLNPPWSDIDPWVHKALKREGPITAMLLPARTDRPWHRDLRQDEGVFIRYLGRIAFNDPLAQGRVSPREGAMIAVVL